ncbi:MAG: LemA family protein [Bdellovibrionales bacterium]|jgi:LemA protein|nr:LemA family protein [Bdellovibrionales bacterium]MBT3525801.1 LemA family protein [Bdellovibrionales bacterium]MBT7668867.1 LemA family protein [Bdellovibrionales bacterium]MBT7768038.1 LemA family protein [Bdellovibrionales bacterium]
MKSITRSFLSTIFILIGAVTLSSCGMQSIPTALNDVEAKWAEVQNQYKRRSDLVPNLVATVKGYASHEKDTLQAVVEARAKATAVNINPAQLNAQTMAKFSQAQGGLSSALGRLMVVVEKYPDLKANSNFRDLQVQLEGTENRITVARNRYIESIKAFNNLVTVPPTSWYNGIFLKHEKKPQFKVENLQQVENAPKVQF